MTIQDFLDKGAVLEVYSDKESYYAQLLSVGESFEDREVWTHADVELKVFGASSQDAIGRLEQICKPLADGGCSAADRVLDAISAMPEAERRRLIAQIKQLGGK